MADISPPPNRELEAARWRARIVGMMYAECYSRRRFWIGGVPTELDLLAARKAVARRQKTTLEIVTAALDAAFFSLENED